MPSLLGKNPGIEQLLITHKQVIVANPAPQAIVFNLNIFSQLQMSSKIDPPPYRRKIEIQAG